MKIEMRRHKSIIINISPIDLGLSNSNLTNNFGMVYACLEPSTRHTLRTFAFLVFILALDREYKTRHLRTSLGTPEFYHCLIPLFFR